MKQNFLRRLGAMALAFALALTLMPTAWAAPGDVRIAVSTSNGSEVTVLDLGSKESFDTSTNWTVRKIVEGLPNEKGEPTYTPTPLDPGQYTVTKIGEEGPFSVNDGNIVTYEASGEGKVRVSLKDASAGAAPIEIIVRVNYQQNIPLKIVKVTAGPEAVVTADSPAQKTLELVLPTKGSTTLAAEIEGTGKESAIVDWEIRSGSSVRLGDPNYSNTFQRSIIAQGNGVTEIRATLSDRNRVEKDTYTIRVNVQDFKVKVMQEMDKGADREVSNTTTGLEGTITLKQGESARVYTQVNESANISENITYTVISDPNGVIGRIDHEPYGRANITASGNSFGQATIQATSGSASIRFFINVLEPGAVDVTGITLNRTELRLDLGDSFTLVATVRPSNAKDKTVSWSVDDGGEGIVRVDENGKVTALKVGEATITARSNYNTTQYATCKVIVSPGLADLVIQNKSSSGQLNMNTSMSKPGQTQQVEARANPSNASFGSVTWTSDNTSVVTIRPDTRYSNGLMAILTTVGPGEATITVACGDVKDTAKVTISGVVIKSGILTMTNGRLTMKEGETDQLTYESFGQAKSLSTNTVPNWLSSDSSVVDVDRITGAITARKSGTATITLELGSGSTYYEAKCEVTVVEDTSAIINAGSVNAGAAFSFDRLRSQLQSVCSQKVGGSLVYINNLAVASTDQGILHDEHRSADDTGAGVGIADKYYINANSAQGQSPLSDLSFVPRTTFNGVAEISFSGWNNQNKGFSGLIRITVNGTGDVMYASGSGDPVAFLASDFNLYHPNLKSVSFTPPSESMGTLYYNYVSASQPGTKVVAGTEYNRTGTPGIDKVTFVPAPNYSGTVRIAYKGTDTAGKTFTGTVTITVTAKTSSKDSADISYTVAEGSWLNLRPTDFNSACLRVLGEGLSYVRFTPPDSSNGTLFYNYRGFSDFDSMVKETTNYYYGGNPSLANVSFVPTTTTPAQVEIKYTGYGDRGNTFEGTIHITQGGSTGSFQTQQRPLNYTVLPGRSVYLNANDFETACRTATGYDLATVQFTSLPGVSQGNLRYTQGSSSTPSNVTTGTRFFRTGASNLLRNVYFQAGNNVGTVRIPFTGTSERGTTFTDTVVINISTTLPTSGTGGTIGYSGTTAVPIRLSAARIRSAVTGALDRELSYITFTSLPSSDAGKLYLGYSSYSSPGELANTGTRYYAAGNPGIDQLSFVPKGRYSGQASAGFTAVSSSGDSVNGVITFSISNTDNSIYFSDMYNHTWAAPSVDYLYQNGVTNGITPTTYGPNQNIKRGDFVLMLCRALGFSGSSGSSFADVPSSAYFAQAVAAAKRMGIVSGDGKNFRPYDAITRQDAMVMIYNAMKAAGKDVGKSATTGLSQFSDSDSISSYAREAVSALVQMGAVNGDNGRLLPRNSITRAEAAVILHFVMTM